MVYAMSKRVSRSLLQLADWPAVDDRVFDEEAKASYRLRYKAVQASARGDTLEQIEATGIHRATVLRMVARAQRPHPDGRLWGWRALQPHVRVQSYERIKPPKVLAYRAGGNSGAFHQLLLRHPSLATQLRGEITGGAVQLKASGERGRLTGTLGASQRLLQACRDAEEEGLPGDLTEQCVLALRILLSRQRPNPGGVHRRTLGRIAKSFVLNTATAVAGNADRPALAWLLASMYWHGCRHPAALRCEALHPATGLVRWLSSFTAVQQVEHPRQIQRLLYAEVLRIHCLSEAIVAAMIQESRGDDRPVALLPELLRFQELPRITSSHTISTVTDAKSMSYW